MWFYLFCYLRNSFQVWWMLKCGKSMKEKLSLSTFPNSEPCLIKCSRFPRLCLDRHSLNGESVRAQCVCRHPAAPGAEKVAHKLVIMVISDHRGHFPFSHPLDIFSIAGIETTHGYTRLHVIITQKQILCTLQSLLNVRFTIGPSEPVSLGNHGKVARREKGSASVFCLKGEWDGIPSPCIPPTTACFMKPSFT